MANISNIGSKWRVLSGQTHWKGLLSPLDIDLRRYIIHYGQMAQATYDSFNEGRPGMKAIYDSFIKGKTSKHAGDCQYNMKDFFAGVGLLGVNNPYKYEVTRYLYATSGVSHCLLIRQISRCLSRESSPKETNWMGYVAVATDEAKTLLGRRDIVIAWRGSKRPSEWLDDLKCAPEPLADWLGAPSDNAKVHKGFSSIYTSTNPKSSHGKSSVRDQVLNEVRRLVDQFKDEDISITVTGHSLGAALAILNTVDIVANKYNIPTNQSPNKACPVTAMAFASPRVGDLNFKKTYSKYEQLRCLRIRNKPDIIPTLPKTGFDHVGEVLDIDTTKSQGHADFHNLEVYLHGVAEG